MRGRIAAMETLQVGDWVKTKAGHEGTILLISRLSAFVEVKDNVVTKKWRDAQKT